MVFRMSGFSVSASEAATLVAPFLILPGSGRATRQSATAAAKMAMSAGSASLDRFAASPRPSRRDAPSTPGGSASATGPEMRRHARAELRRRRRDGVTLLAGGAVGDIAHRIDRLVRRAAGHQHMAARERQPARGRTTAPQKLLDALRRSPALPPCAPDPLRRARPSRRRWARRNGCRRLRGARRCAVSPDGATCAGSSPAPRARACRSRAAPPSRDRWHGPAPSGPEDRRSPARRR